MLCQGVIQAVSDKKSVFTTKFGAAYNLNFKVNEVWYQLPFCKPEAPLPLQAGQQVEFMYESQQNGQYTNNSVNKKSLNVNGAPFADQPMPGGGYQQPPPNQQQQQGGYGQQPQQNQQAPAQQQQQAQQRPPFQAPPQQQQAPAQQAPMRNSKKVPGIAIGMALNNAVAMIAGGKVQVNAEVDLMAVIEQVAWDIIQLSDKMNKMVEQGFYPNEQKAPQQQQTPVQQQAPPPDPQPQPQSYAGQQPPPQQQQQAAPQQGGYGPAGGQQPGNAPGFDDFDDDIPF